MELEQFATRLAGTLEEQFRAARHPYVSIPVIQKAIVAAIHPMVTTAEFPLMLYRGTSEQRIVNDGTEEEVALSEGFTRTAPLQYEAGFPKTYRERLTTEGGSKWPSGDVRKVLLRTPAGERMFHAVVESEGWIADDGSRGGRGISLDALVEERRQMLMRLAGNELFAIELPHEVDVPDDASQSGQNPDEDSPPEETPGAEAQQE